MSNNACLDIPRLYSVIMDLFEKSGDGARYSAIDRQTFDDQFKVMSFLYKKIVFAQIPDSLSDDVKLANDKITEINKKLNETLNSLQEINQFVNDCRLIVQVLDSVVKQIPLPLT